MERDQRHRLNVLMQRLATGDRSAFLPVYELTWPVVRAFVRRALDDPGSAEDAAQEVLLKVFRQAPEFDREKDALSWIFAISSFEIRTELKRRSRNRETEPIDPATSVESDLSPEVLAIDRQLVRAVRSTLAGLDERDIETIIQSMEDRRPRGVLPATFRKRLQRALGRLRQAWSVTHGME